MDLFGDKKLLSYEDLKEVGSTKVIRWLIKNEGFPKPLRIGKRLKFIRPEVEEWLMTRRREKIPDELSERMRAQGNRGNQTRWGNPG